MWCRRGRALVVLALGWACPEMAWAHPGEDEAKRAHPTGEGEGEGGEGESEGGEGESEGAGDEEAGDEEAGDEGAGDVVELSPDYVTREIVVEAPMETAGATTITAEEIAAIPVRTAEDSLRLAPGLVLVQHGAEGKGQQFFMRGFDAVHGIDFEVEVDGVPINEWSNVHAQGYLDLGMFIPELIRSVEVLPGPFVLDQGPFALAGSARMELGVAEEDRGLRASLGFGSTGRLRALVTYAPKLEPGEEDDGRFVAAEVMTDPGYGESRDSRRAVVMVRQPLYTRAGDRVTATLIGQAAAFGLPGTTSLAEYEAGRIGFWGAQDNGEGDAQRGQASVEWKRSRARWQLRALAWGGYRRLELMENFTGFLEEPVYGDRRVQRHEDLPFGARADAHVHLGPRLELRAGLGVRGDSFAQSEERVDLQRRPFETTRDLRATQVDAWSYVGVRWWAVDALEINAGARVDVFAFDALDQLGTSEEDEEGEVVESGAVRGGGVRAAASPRLSLRWSPLRRLEAFAAYGRGFRPPEARAFITEEVDTLGVSSDRVDDEGPSTSASDSGELGLRWRPLPALSVSVLGFATYLKGESIYDHVSRRNLELAATRRLGVELDLDARPLPWLGVAASLTWVDGRFIASGNPIPLAPTLVGSARAWLAHRLGARAGLMVFGWAPRPLPYGATGSGMVRVDATLGWHLDRVRVDLAVENLLGMRLREGEYYFASNFQPGEAASQLPTLHYVPGPPLNARATLTFVF
ncbi:TonB-dependent receptor [Pseudenhygromyxa sp. WMMC2535]|nr:TonB-dependent receptor [Pseudenhygromyxa sp. WMMC2535]